MTIRDDFKCIDCGVDTSQHGIAEYYMVHNAVWWKAGMTTTGGMLCIGCLEERLGRELTAVDFTTAPLNDIVLFGPGMCSDRLKDRLTRI